MRITFNEIRRNNVQTWFLIFLFFLLISLFGLAVGVYIGDVFLGLIITTLVGIIYTLVVFSTGDKMIMSISGAKPVTKREYPYLYHTVEGLAVAAGLPTPKCYVINDSALNAFATGKKPESASIAVTTGLLEKMNRQELEGVIAHEMSHIKNNDIRVMMLAAVLVGVILLLSQFLLRSFLWGGKGSSKRENNKGTIILILIGLALAILAPFISELIKLSISRKREYMADASGAILTRYPAGLASALRKIAKDPDPLVDNANKATAHLFISTPFRMKKNNKSSLFSTHPPIDERIKRLEEM
ncbi:MAG: zinc metalloprotease HtpX [Nanoarchaeota archaeon]|nr:zinc metalloprotease HtpX [Nanoarchaeota archaeon]MBU1030885.1 zinc metalloprotease HtpX [Nanoarchaeota archaeon]MBU1849447.1 zinc metalloprotease HtpX [Nanoarchaeota archaeon]